MRSLQNISGLFHNDGYWGLRKESAQDLGSMHIDWGKHAYGCKDRHEPKII